jgi:hypothetical protein
VAVSTQSTLRANARSGGVRVLGRHLPVLFLAPSPDLHNPPHKQLLVGLEVGGARRLVLLSSSSSSSSSCFPIVPVHPPALLFHPLSTPQAVAHGARGGWCSLSCSPLLLLLLLVLFPHRPHFPSSIVVPPTIHPTSSCSWG